MARPKYVVRIEGATSVSAFMRHLCTFVRQRGIETMTMRQCNGIGLGREGDTSTLSGKSMVNPNIYTVGDTTLGWQSVEPMKNAQTPPTTNVGHGTNSPHSIVAKASFHWRTFSVITSAQSRTHPQTGPILIKRFVARQRGTRHCHMLPAWMVCAFCHFENRMHLLSFWLKKLRISQLQETTQLVFCCHPLFGG